MLIGQRLGWGTGSPCAPLRASLLPPGGFLRRIPAAAAVSLRVLLASSAKILEGTWPCCRSIPGKLLCWPRPLVPVTAKAGDELHLPARTLGSGEQTGGDPTAAGLASRGDAFPRHPPACPAFSPLQRWEGNWDGAACVATPAAPRISLPLPSFTPGRLSPAHRSSKYQRCFTLLLHSSTKLFAGSV